MVIFNKSQLLADASNIRFEVNAEQNTAERVGKMFVDIIEALGISIERLKQYIDSDINEALSNIKLPGSPDGGGDGDYSGYVTISTDQVINGLKRFRKPLRLGSSDDYVELWYQDDVLHVSTSSAIEGLLKALAGIEVGTFESGASGAAISKAGDAELNSLIVRLKAALGSLEVEKESVFGGDVSSPDFVAGYLTGKGWAITKREETTETGETEDRYTAEVDDLIVRLKALVGELEVKGDSVFDGRLSSPEFISGFLGGKGWAITKREVLNALGVPEDKYTAEFDDVVVRGALRVFSLVVSQLLGENDNRVFTGMAEVDHYDADAGVVWLDTKGGQYYNPFRKGDYIMVQQFNGAPTAENDYYITKHYELIITDAGIGSLEDGDKRLDWVRFKNFVSADGRGEDVTIAKGDTFTRVDSETDVDRKGLIQIITVGSATPYMDVVYGMKTDPDNALKGRLGNLQGIRHHLFGWLDGFGELLTNLYAVGDFRLRRTGESLDSKIEMLRGVFESRYRSLTYALTEDDNYLHNASFAEQMSGWSATDDGSILTSNGEALLMNGNTYISDGRIAGIEEVDGHGMLHLKKSGVRQLNELIRKPGTHRVYTAGEATDLDPEYTDVPDTLYLSIKYQGRSSGVLTVGFEGCGNDTTLPHPASVSISNDGEWHTLQWSGVWDGAGDFVIECSGEVYVSLLSLTDRALDDYKEEVSTSIEQTSSRIRLVGNRIDNLNGSVTQIGIDLNAAKGELSLYAEQTAERFGELESGLSEIKITVDGISSTVVQTRDDLDKAKEIAAAASEAAQKAADDAMKQADSAFKKALENEDILTSYGTTITQNAKFISAIAGLFDSNGKPLAGSGWVLTGEFATLYSQVQSIDGQMSAKAEVSTSVQYDPATGKVTSGIKLSADQIDINGVTTINNTFKIEADGTTHIGMFTIDETGLHNTVNDNNLAYLYPGKFQIKRSYSYDSVEYARIECCLGDDANPDKDNLSDGSMAAYFKRKFVGMLYTERYTPAVLIDADEGASVSVGLEVKGGVRVHGGLMACGNQLTLTGASGSNVIDVSSGTTIVVHNSSANAAVFLPTRSTLCRQVGKSTSDYFSLPITIVGSITTEDFVLTTYKNASGSGVSEAEAGKLINNNAGEWESSKLTLGKGDIVSLLLVNTAGGYYAQRIGFMNY